MAQFVATVVGNIWCLKLSTWYNDIKTKDELQGSSAKHEKIMTELFTIKWLQLRQLPIGYWYRLSKHDTCTTGCFKKMWLAFWANFGWLNGLKSERKKIIYIGNADLATVQNKKINRFIIPFYNLKITWKPIFFHPLKWAQNTHF